jgi:hypothetical protein
MVIRCTQFRESSKGKGKGRCSGFIRHCGIVKPIIPSPLEFLPTPLEALCTNQTHSALC